MNSFENQSIIITGAGSGIGRATAKLFAEKGANVIASDINEVGGQETIANIQAKGGIAIHAIRIDGGMRA